MKTLRIVILPGDGIGPETMAVAVAARGWRCTSGGRDAHAAWARLDSGSESEVALTRLMARFEDVNRWTDVGRLGEELEVMGMLAHNGRLIAGRQFASL